MARKVVPLIRFDNYKQFIDYINTRINIYTDDRVAELIKLGKEANAIYRQFEQDFEKEYNVFTHEPGTHTDKHKKLIQEMEITAFEKLNDCVEDTPKLKVAFRNAQGTKRHKDKIKYTENDRVVIEMGYNERAAINRLRGLCRDNNLDFRSVINDCAYKIKKESENNVT